MSLENLLKIGQIKAHAPDKQHIAKLLAAAARNLHDAGIKENSTETRFDAAYKTIMQSAMVALQARGYRPDTNRPGHHATAIQSLPLTLGISNDRTIVLDKLRAKRNLSDYTGADLDEVSAKTCMAEAKALLAEVKGWLRRNHPELVE